MSRITLRIDDETERKLKQKATENNQNLSEYIRDKLNNHDNKNNIDIQFEIEETNKKINQLEKDLTALYESILQMKKDLEWQGRFIYNYFEYLEQNNVEDFHKIINKTNNPNNINNEETEFNNETDNENTLNPDDFGMLGNNDWRDEENADSERNERRQGGTLLR